MRQFESADFPYDLLQRGENRENHLPCDQLFFWRKGAGKDPGAAGYPACHVGDLHICQLLRTHGHIVTPSSRLAASLRGNGFSATILMQGDSLWSHYAARGMESGLSGGKRKMTTKTYNVGIYCRLSNDDERDGESVSIENQDEICQGVFLQNLIFYKS